MLPRHRATALLGGLLLLVATACSAEQGPAAQTLETAAGSDSGTSRDGPDDRAVFAHGDETPSLDPTTGTHSNLVAFGAAETLLDPLPDGSLQGRLVETWERTSDVTWAFTLREGVTFHSGEALDAQKVVDAIEVHREASESVAAALEGAEVRAEDERNFTITTPAADVTIPNLLASPFRVSIFDVAAFDEAGENIDAQIAAGMFTGPYKPVSLDVQRLVLEAYPDYWGGTPALAGVEVVTLPDAQNRVSAVQNGEADIAIYPPDEAQQVLEGDETTRFNSLDLANGSAFVRLSTEGPLANRDVRRAITLAYDYEGTPELTNGAFTVAEGFYPPTLSYSVALQETDVDEARRLLDEAGWEPGEDGVRTKDGERLAISYLFNAGSGAEETFGLALRAQLAAVGIELELVEVEDTGESELPPGWGMKTHTLATESADNAPVSILRRWFLQDPTGPVTDPEFQAIVDGLVSGEGDPAEFLEQAQRLILVDQAYAFVMGHYTVKTVTDAEHADYVPPTRLTFVSSSSPSP